MAASPSHGCAASPSVSSFEEPIQERGLHPKAFVGGVSPLFWRDLGQFLPAWCIYGRGFISIGVCGDVFSSLVQQPGSFLPLTVQALLICQDSRAVTE